MITPYPGDTAQVLLFKIASALTGGGGGGGGGVSSFNTRTGAVTLTAGDISGALGYVPASSASGVASFNTRTGAVTLTSGDVTGALGFTPASNAAVVASFNTRTGAVTLTSGDVTGALGFTPASNAAVVASFNTRTGAVTLTSGDVTGALGFTPISAADGDSFYVLKAGDVMSGNLQVGSCLIRTDGSVEFASAAFTILTDASLISTGAASFSNGLASILIDGTGNFSGQLSGAAGNFVVDASGNIEQNGTARWSSQIFQVGFGSIEQNRLNLLTSGQLTFVDSNPAEVWSLNPDGSVHFASGAVSIDTAGVFAPIVVTSPVDQTAITLNYSQTGANPDPALRLNLNYTDSISANQSDGILIDITDDLSGYGQKPFRILWNTSENFYITSLGEVSAVGGLAGFGGDGQVYATNLTGGQYTPTLTDVTNSDELILNGQFVYSRLGNVVTVSGSVEAHPVVPATTMRFRVSLPVATTFGDLYQCSGTGAVSGGSVPEALAIYGDVTNQEAVVEFLTSAGGTGGQLRLIFSYLIAE